MKMRRLGAHGPEISLVGFGAWEAGGRAWGPNPPDDQVIEAMQAALDSGMTWIDTAEVYGPGRSEELVGRAIEGRDDVLVFTKVAPKPGGTGFRKDEIRAAAENSLKRLGRDVIDVYQLHWPSPDVPVEETWEAMSALVDDGSVRYIGVSNFNRELIDRCENIRHVDSLQPHFSMLWQQHRDLIDYCGTNGTGVVAYAPLGYGLLTGAFDEDTEFSDDDWRGGNLGMGGYERLFAPGKYEENLKVVDALRPVADRLDISPAQLALAWVFHQRGATAAIAGSRNPKHVRENAKAGDVDLSDKDLDELADILRDRPGA